MYENKRMAAQNSKASNADGCATPLKLEKEAKIKKMPSCGRAEGSWWYREQGEAVELNGAHYF